MDDMSQETQLSSRVRLAASIAGTVMALICVTFTLTVLLAAAARAEGLSAAELARVAGGEAVVRVEPTDGLADALVIGAVDIPASVSAVWEVLVSCEHAAQIMPNLASCRVLEAAPDGASDVREHRIRWISLLPEIRSEFRSQYELGRSIRFSRSGGDMRALDGEWRVESRSKGAVTRLHYVARVGFGAFIPAFAIRSALAKDVPGFLDAIRAQSVRALEPRTVAR